MKEYNPEKIEKKWQKKWEEKKTYQAKDKSKQPKYYSLIEFPYPSGDGLHVGHPRPYIGMDVISRKRRLDGLNVLFPIGWDAFGLPTENYAIKTGKDPRVVTKKNTDIFRRQIKSLGVSFDWSREINTTDPKYYKWTQWIFLQFFKHGLAYKAKMAINWCPKDKIGLANEEVVAGCCERCGTPVEKREKEQWMLAITKYADRLYKDLDDVDYLPQIKLAQRNWIGKSEGAEIEFLLNFKKNPKDNERRGPDGKPALIKVFTTRPDTIFGATYLVMAPEHLWITLATDNNHDVLENKEEIKTYIKKVKNKTEIDRTSEGKEKTGVEVKGVVAINPATKQEIPIWVADYVLPQYGTGAIMAVPADDARDKEFAEKFNLAIIENYKKAGMEDYGKKVTKFKLRDWIFSRQRYWGEPIPIINCEKCGLVPVPEKDLPVELPKLTGKIKNYLPTDSGESPLANISKWVNVKCPKCKGKAKRETDTMPNWAGSSWYFLRYADPKNSKAFADPKKLKYWIPVDWYNGGNEHTTLHLLYSRFWHKFLFDLGLVPTSEPYKKRTSHGLILAEGGEKMSKSRGNVINPDEIVKTYGADTLRLYEMFMGPFDQAIAWSEEAIIGPRRFLEKVWKIGEKVSKQKNSSVFTLPGLPGGSYAVQNSSVSKLLNKTIKKVEEDIQDMRFNTAISSMMILATEMDKNENVNKEDYKKFLQILSPFAPHITEELWSRLGEKKSINNSTWPAWDQNLIVDDEIKIVIQVNGKVRAEMIIQSTDQEVKIKDQALKNEDIVKYIAGKEVKKVIYVKNRLVNIVV
ncbi:MAG: class I tRNA ligase family protein [Candidatus Paceibacterota bacterium]